MEAFYLLPSSKHKFGFAFYFVVQKYKRLLGWSESRLETLKEISLANVVILSLILANVKFCAIFSLPLPYYFQSFHLIFNLSSSPVITHEW